MGAIAHGARWAVDGVLWPFDVLPAGSALVAVSVITGVAMLGVVRVTTRQRSVARARDRMAAAVYEIRLFLDQPRQVLAGQARFLAASGAYLLHMVPALLALMVPLGLLYVHLETRFGLAPLTAGEPVVVRVDLREGVDGESVTVTGAGDAAVTAPLLYDRPRQRVYARVVVHAPTVASLRVATPRGAEVKSLVANPRARRVSPERRRGLSVLWSYGHEAPLSDDAGIERIAVPYPDRPNAWFGMPWWAWWLAIATVAALLLRRPLRVVV